MKFVTILGARPQFIKAATVTRAFAALNASSPGRVKEVILHTGQHYDENMSGVFFNELGLPSPDYNLGIVAHSHGTMVGRMIEHIETVLIAETPEWVIIYGDTNSTLAGALAAAKLNIPIAHVEAGLRSFNMRMPEEINRIVADRLATKLFCPTGTAVENLKQEGRAKGVYQVGDVMLDACLFYTDMALAAIGLDRWDLEEKKYVLVTIHRAENTDDPVRLRSIFYALNEIASDLPVILPLHPRTRRCLETEQILIENEKLKIIEPASYLEMMRLEHSAAAILTDSGGVQKEAYFHEVPCLTLRDETEWIETTASGWNQLCGADTQKILACWGRCLSNPDLDKPSYYGSGDASEKIAKLLLGG